MHTDTHARTHTHISTYFIKVGTTCHITHAVVRGQLVSVSRVFPGEENYGAARREGDLSHIFI